MYDNELYHFGVKGMKWGVRKTPEQIKAEYSVKRAKKMDKYQTKVRKKKEKSEARDKRISGNQGASLERMNEAELRRYSKNRISIKGSKTKAIGSETSNVIKKAAKTIGIVGGVTAASALALGGGAAAAPVYSLLTAKTAWGASAAYAAAGANFTNGAIAGGVLSGITTGSAGGINMAVKGSRYIRNIIGISSTNHDKSHRRK